MNNKYDLRRLITIDKHVVYVGLGLIIGCAIIWNMGWSGKFLPSHEDLASWFQRSGSLSLILCVFSELFLLNQLSIASTIIRGAPDVPQPFANVWFKSLSKFTKVIIHLLTVTSIVICGYGEVIYKSIT